MEHGEENIRILHFAADLWEHVCPVLRITGPVDMSGMTLIRGNQWQEGKLVAYPELISDADIVIIQRDFPRYATEYETILETARSACKPVIYEVDDLLTELPPIHPDVQHYMSVRTHVLGAIIEADAVTCSTAALSDYIKIFNPNVDVIPNYLNDTWWTLRDLSQSQEKAPDESVVIGYLGAHSHTPDLAMVAPVLEGLLDEYGEKLRIRLWGIQPPPSLKDRPNVEWLDPGLVNYREFAAYFSQQTSDIFIAPLIDNQFNRCKSSIKFLEYSCLGVPGVFSDLPPYSSVMKHGKNGFLARTEGDWRDLLKQLVDDKEMRQRMGKAAQATLCKNWLLSDHLDRWMTTYKKLTGKAKGSYSGERISEIVRKYIHWGDQERDLRLQQIDGLERQVGSFSNEISLLDSKIKTSETELARRVEEIETLKDQTSALDAELKKRNAQVEQMREKVERHDEVVDNLEALVAQREGRIHQLDEHIYAITHSAGWQFLEVLYRIRLFVAPRGSLRERIIIYLKRAASILRHEGLGVLWSKASYLIRSGNLRERFQTPVSEDKSPAVQIQDVPDHQPCPSPAISLLIDKNSSTGVNTDAVIDWVKKQTLNSIEIVIWDRKLGSASTSETPGHIWEAPDVKTLLAGLAGRYVCIASEDLLMQNQVYLETNLLALESEALAFTINTFGSPEWIIRGIRAGCLPGDHDQPLLRLVLRKECLNEELTIDLETWLSQRGESSAIAGKIITHTTKYPESGEAFPLEQPVGDLEISLDGPHLLVRKKDTFYTEPPRLQLYHLDQALPLPDDENKLPTVIILIQFLAMGGAERFALNLVQQLKDRFRFVVIALEGLDRSLGTTADDFHQATPYTYVISDYLHPALTFSFLEYIVKRFHPECLYIANGSTWIYDSLTEMKRRFPDVHIVNQVYDHHFGWINRYNPEIAISIDAHIGANPKICKEYQMRGAKSSRVFFIEHGIDLDEIDPNDYPQERRIQIRKNLGLPTGSKIVTFAARLHPQKRPMDFVELARRFTSDENVSFLMVGDGSLAGAIDEQVDKIGLKNFYRIPFYTPISNIYAITDVLVLPSEYEAMPLVILESQAMGVPAVVTDVGSNRDVIEMTHGGFVVSGIGDINLLREGVISLLSNPCDQAYMREKIRDRFGIKNISKKFEKLFLGEIGA